MKKPKSDKQLKTYETKMTSALEAANKCDIQKFEDVMESADFLYEVKQVAEKLEDDKTTVLKPFLDGAKLMRKLFKPAEETYEQAEKIVKDKILAWHVSEWDKGNTPDNKISGLNGSVTVVERIVAQVDDATKIPREFMVPDLEKITHALKANIEVPGAKLAPTYHVTSTKN